MTKQENERIAVIEIKVENIQSSMNLLLTNHLPHIQDEITGTNDRLDNLQKWVIGLLVSVNLILIASYITLWAN